MRRKSFRSVKRKTPSSAFKKALKKLKGVRSNHKKNELIKNSSDAFIRDLASAMRTYQPGFDSFISRKAAGQVKRFSNPRTSMTSRRRMISQRGGIFLDLLNSIVSSVGHTLFGK